MIIDEARIFLDLSSQGFKDPEVKTICGIITRHLSGDELARFWSSKLVLSDFPMMTKFDLLSAIRDKTGVASSEMFIELFKYAPQVGGKNIGRGERLLGVCMGGNPTSTNDFATSDGRFEVKCDGRIKGQVGFDMTHAGASRRHIENVLSERAGAHDILLSELYDPSNDNSLNFFNHRNKKKKFFLPGVYHKFLHAMRDVVWLDDAVKAKLTADWICDMFVIAMSKYYTRMNDDEKTSLKDSLVEEFDDNRMKIPKSGQSMFVMKLAAFALKYYQRIESFDYIVFMNADVECIIIPSHVIIDSTLYELAHYINLEFKVCPPSLSDKANQASSFLFKLR